MNNSLGKIFTVCSFGESHGKVVGCVIEGIPAGIEINLLEVQQAVNKRKPKEEAYQTPRIEADKINILSGMYGNKTLGSPLCIIINNENAQSIDYDNIKDIYRPGHADYTYDIKYGIRDYRGGGRSSIRITAPLVAAGDIARQILLQYIPIDLICYVSQIGNVKVDNKMNWQKEAITESVIFCPDKIKSQQMLDSVATCYQEGDTLGGAIFCIIKNLPAGIGEPIFGKLQAMLSHAMMSINTVKSIAWGDGIHSAAMKGSEMNDSFINNAGEVKTKTNHHGGILGGISSGMNIPFEVFFKPISSIKISQQTINKNLQEVTVTVQGRHDVCAVPRAVAIIEAYTYIVLLDLYLQNKMYKHD